MSTKFTSTIRIFNVTFNAFDNDREEVNTYRTSMSEIDSKDMKKSLQKALDKGETGKVFKVTQAKFNDKGEKTEDEKTEEVKSSLSVLKIKSNESNLFLFTVPGEVFTEKAKKMSRRGEEGRTRTPVITRTIDTVKFTFTAFDNDREEVNTYRTSMSEIDSKDMKKSLQKALDKGETGKVFKVTQAKFNDKGEKTEDEKTEEVKSSLSVLKIKSNETESNVYEMKVYQFIRLCEEKGTKEKSTYIPVSKRPKTEKTEKDSMKKA